MSAVEVSVVVHADTQRAYEMMTEFEHYSDFMPGVEEVRRTGETLMHWTVRIDGERHEWETQTVQMEPEHLIVFQSLHQEPPIRYTLAFDPVSDGTQIRLTLENDPRGEGATRDYLTRSLQRLKEIMEQGPPTRWPSAPQQASSV